ncbi:neurofibromin [Anaeramoeba flamelloides]|uniref:Neurofibromin n=1 Tax=Anaeramoeba flamelloides TaxID=1746091 RepID=A0AAV8A141_9EUKA|nr:neurofibromin [Anaeramoeba flamelloides]
MSNYKNNYSLNNVSHSNVNQLLDRIQGLLNHDPEQNSFEYSTQNEYSFNEGTSNNFLDLEGNKKEFFNFGKEKTKISISSDEEETEKEKETFSINNPNSFNLDNYLKTRSENKTHPQQNWNQKKHQEKEKQQEPEQEKTYYSRQEDNNKREYEDDNEEEEEEEDEETIKHLQFLIEKEDEKIRDLKNKINKNSSEKERNEQMIEKSKNIESYITVDSFLGQVDKLMTTTTKLTTNLGDFLQNVGDNSGQTNNNYNGIIKTIEQVNNFNLFNSNTRSISQKALLKAISSLSTSFGCRLTSVDRQNKVRTLIDSISFEGSILNLRHGLNQIMQFFENNDSVKIACSNSTNKKNLKKNSFRQSQSQYKKFLASLYSLFDHIIYLTILRAKILTLMKITIIDHFKDNYSKNIEKNKTNQSNTNPEMSELNLPVIRSFLGSINNLLKQNLEQQFGGTCENLEEWVNIIFNKIEIKNSSLVTKTIVNQSKAYALGVVLREIVFSILNQEQQMQFFKEYPITRNTYKTEFELEIKKKRKSKSKNENENENENEKGKGKGKEKETGNENKNENKNEKAKGKEMDNENQNQQKEKDKEKKKNIELKTESEIIMNDIKLKLKNYLNQNDIEFLLKALQLDIIRIGGDKLIERIYDLFDSLGLSSILMKILIDQSIAISQSVDDLLKPNTILARFITKFLRYYGQNYLKKTLGELIKRQLSSNRSLEINPNRVSRREELYENINLLREFFYQYVDRIFNSPNDLPMEFSFIFSYFRMKIEKKFPNHLFPLIGSLIFLRFFCPALISPENYNLTEFNFTIEQRRGLFIICTLFQALSNGTIIPKSSLQFQPFNEDLKKCYPGRARFLEEISKKKINFDLDQKDLFRTFKLSSSQSSSSSTPSMSMSSTKLSSSSSSSKISKNSKSTNSSNTATTSSSSAMILPSIEPVSSYLFLRTSHRSIMIELDGGIKNYNNSANELGMEIILITERLSKREIPFFSNNSDHHKLLTASKSIITLNDLILDLQSQIDQSLLESSPIQSPISSSSSSSKISTHNVLNSSNSKQNINKNTNGIKLDNKNNFQKINLSEIGNHNSIGKLQIDTSTIIKSSWVFLSENKEQWKRRFICLKTRTLEIYKKDVNSQTNTIPLKIIPLEKKMKIFQTKGLGDNCAFKIRKKKKKINITINFKTLNEFNNWFKILKTIIKK